MLKTPYQKLKKLPHQYHVNCEYSFHRDDPGNIPIPIENISQIHTLLSFDDCPDLTNEDPESKESSRLKALALKSGPSTVDLDGWGKNVSGFKKDFMGE